MGGKERAFKVRWMILLVCLSHCVKGRRKGKQGGWSHVPHRERRVSRANSLPFPEHQRSHCYQLLLWPQQKTSDPRVEGYFHDRTKAFCPGTEEPRKRTRHANPCGGCGFSSTQGTGCAHAVTFAGTYHCWVFRALPWSLPCQGSLIVSLWLHFMESCVQHKALSQK